MNMLTQGKFAVTEKSSPRLLVVDDEALIRWSLSERLSTAGYDVHGASDGASALAYFRNGPSEIDLVVLDIRLPDVDGVNLLKQIKRVSPTCRVILMTAFGSPEKLEEARKHGAFAVVVKPFSLESMVGVVQRALVA